MSFINTKSLYANDQAALDALLEGDVYTELKDSDVTMLAKNALRYQQELVSVDFPNVGRLDEGCLANCPKLETIRIGGYSLSNISSDALTQSNNLKSIIFDTTEGVLRFMTAPPVVGCRNCIIYVPDSMLSTYKSAAYTKYYRHSILPLSKYPASNIETVSDTWAEIAAAALDGTHSTKYAVDDIKILTLSLNDGALIIDAYMQYVGDRPEGPVWVLLNPFLKRRFNSTACSYESSEIDTYLNTELFNLFPNELQSAIVNVPITFYDGLSDTEKTINRKVWLLSSYELINGNSSYKKETTGYTFQGLLLGESNNSAMNALRRKMPLNEALNVSSGVQYWSRTVTSSGNLIVVGSSGSMEYCSYDNANNVYVVFAFVLQGPPVSSNE